MRYAVYFTSVALCVFFALTGNISAQGASDGPLPFATVYQNTYKKADVSRTVSLGLTDERSTEEKKSGFVAVLYSLALPGMGELYAGRFDKGKYPLILEAGLWLGMFGVNSYGNWVQDDARLYAQQHAGIDPAGKDDDFYIDIENYADLYDYNNQMLVERRLEDLYPDESGWRWQWDSEENRLEYKDQRIFSDELYNGVTFFVLGMVANRIWSAIQAAVAVKAHNASLLERMTALPTLESRITSYAGRADGVQFVFSW
jgi:uncharacterized membrane protein